MDPTHHEQVAALRKYVEELYAFTRTLGALDPLLYEGHEVLLNVSADEHTDRHDPRKSWVIIATLGNHQGGHLFIRHLNLRIRMEPGRRYCHALGTSPQAQC